MSGEALRYSRRAFIAGGAACVTLSRPSSLLAAVLQVRHGGSSGDDQRLTEGWEFYRGPLDPRFQVWHSEELVTWQPVSLPHCFNVYDGCDPDVPAYRGAG